MHSLSVIHARPDIVAEELRTYGFDDEKPLLHAEKPAAAADVASAAHTDQGPDSDVGQTLSKRRAMSAWKRTSAIFRESMQADGRLPRGFELVAPEPRSPIGTVSSETSGSVTDADGEGVKLRVGRAAGGNEWAVVAV
jgi:hypothetical protein